MLFFARPERPDADGVEIPQLVTQRCPQKQANVGLSGGIPSGFNLYGLGAFLAEARFHQQLGDAPALTNPS